MNPIRRQFALLIAFAASALLISSTALYAQSTLGGAKRKANELKEKEKQEPEKKDDKKDKKQENKEPVVFAMGPDEKAHFEIDPASKRNVLKFESKAPKETIESKVTKIAGFLDFNPRKLDAIEGKFTVAWKDVDTGDKKRNGHLMKAPWVDAEQYPDVVFTVTAIENASAKDKPIKAIKGVLVGTMAINGKEKEMKIPVTLTYMESASRPKKDETPHDMLGIRAGKFKIALADFDIKGKSVGEKVAAEQEFTTAVFMLTGPEHKAENKEGMPKPTKKPPPRPKGA